MKMFGKIDRLEKYGSTSRLDGFCCHQGTVLKSLPLMTRKASLAPAASLNSPPMRPGACTCGAVPSPVPPMGMSNISVKIRKLLRGYRAPTCRQRDRGTKDVVGVVHLFDRGQAFDVGTKALRSAVRFANAQQVRISTGKCDRVESPPCVAAPVLVSLFFQFVRPVGERRKNFDQHMVATKAKRRRFHRYAGGCASELVGNDRAAGRYSLRHGLNEDIYRVLIERRKRARFHECPPPIHNMGVEHRQRSSIANRVHGVVKQSPELKQWR